MEKMTTYMTVILIAGAGAVVDAKDVSSLYTDIVLWGIIICGLFIIISAEMRKPDRKFTFWQAVGSIAASLTLCFLSIGFYVDADYVDKYMLYILISASLLFGNEVVEILRTKAPAVIGNGILSAITNLLSGTLTFITKKKSNEDGNDNL